MALFFWVHVLPVTKAGVTNQKTTRIRLALALMGMPILRSVTAHWLMRTGMIWD
jgi:hypothetical protein